MIDINVIKLDAAANVSTGSFFSSVKHTSSTPANSTTACSQHAWLVTHVYKHHAAFEVNMVLERESIILEHV